MNSAFRVCHLFKRSQRLFKHVILTEATPSCVWQVFRHSHVPSDNNVVKNLDFDVKELTSGNESLMKKLNVLVLEVDIWRQEGERIPSRLKAEEWKELLGLDSRNARKKFLLFCFKKEMKKSNEVKKKELKRIVRNEYIEEKINERRDQEHYYGLGGNSMFMRIRESTMNNFLNGKLIEAMQFSQELVIDCGYEQHMNRRETRNCAKQLMLLFSENRMHINPFNLYFCNARRDSWCMQEFEKIIKTAFDPHFPLNITEKSYLELFDKKQLVYLTPHCREELTDYDHNAVYIIGGLVDKVKNEPVSLARAKEQNLKMAKLPLDRFLAWGSGSGKSLTLNQMIMILLDLRHSGDWKKALRHVPTRKIQQLYKVDYSNSRFQLAGTNKEQYKDAYSNLVLNRVKKQG